MQTALRLSRLSTSSDALNLKLHPKQWVAFETAATECLYGGAAGGGKSHLMRSAAIVWCAEIPGLQIYLFRRIRDDLVKNHMEGPKGFRALLAGWVNAGWCSIVEDEIRFWNGSKIYLCHCKDEKDIYKYQGAEIHVLLVDELTHFTETMYRFLRNRVRMVGLTVPEKYSSRFPRILCGANPGNIGHLWVKSSFVVSSEPLEIRLMPANDGGMLRQYIPARLDDNPSMAEDDPGYEHRLEGLGSDTLVRAMRWGDWDVIEGAFFDCWDREKHVLAPFVIPPDWLRFRSVDWGSAAPFSVGWWAVVGDDYDSGSQSVHAGIGPVERRGAEFVSGRGAQVQDWPAGGRGARSDGPRLSLPRGALVRYREWYGASSPNVGLKLTAEEVAQGILDKTPADEKITYTVADPSMWKQDGGPSLAERFVKAGLTGMKPADNTRVARLGAIGGWDLMRHRLKGLDGVPMLYVFSTCKDFIRTVPALQHDPDRPEDVQTDAEDHCGDESRYACSSRPWIPKPKVEPKPTELIYTAQSDGRIVANMSVMDWVRQQERKKARE